MLLPKWLTYKYPIWLAAFVVLMVLGDIFTTRSFLNLGYTEGVAFSKFMMDTIGFWQYGAIRILIVFAQLFSVRWVMNSFDKYYIKKGYSHKSMVACGLLLEMIMLIVMAVTGLLVVCWNARLISQYDDMSQPLWWLVSTYASLTIGL